jgi:hypothetical protein
MNQLKTRMFNKLQKQNRQDLDINPLSPPKVLLLILGTNHL